MSTLQEELLKAIAGAGAKSKASLMSGINSAGQQYFQTPYNIPSTFGDYYVGSPTSVISDFVPLPLDFLESKLEDIQEKYDLAQTAIKSEPGELNKLIPLAPYHEDKRGLIMGNTLKEIEELSRAVLRDPTQSSRTAARLAELRSNIQQNPLYNQYAVEGYRHFTENVAPNMKKEGFNTGIIGEGFYDPATGQYRQISQTSPKVILNNWQKYFNDELSPKFTASLRNKLQSQGIQYDEASGKYYDTKTKTEISGIDPNDPKYGKYYKQAIADTANLILSGQGDAFEVARQKEGLDSFDKAYEFVLRNVSPQFYQREQDSEVINVVGGTGSGKDKDKNPPQPSATVFEIPVSSSGGSEYKTYQDLKTKINSTTKPTTEEGFLNKNTWAPTGTVQEIADMTGLDVDFLAKYPEYQSFKNQDGSDYTLTTEIGSDITGRTDLWGEGLNVQGTVDYTFRREGDLIIPVIKSINAKYQDGVALDKDKEELLKVTLYNKAQEAENLIRDRERINSQITSEIKTLYDKNDKSFNTVRGRDIINSSVEKQIYNNLGIYAKEVKASNKWPEIKFYDASGKELTAQEKYNLVEAEKKKNPELIEKAIKDNLELLSEKTGLGDKMTSRFYEKQVDGMSIISFSEGEGQQTPEAKISELSRLENDMKGRMGYFEYDESSKTVKGSKNRNSAMYGAILDKAKFLTNNDDVSPNTPIGITKADGEKYGVNLMYNGFGMNPKGEFVFTYNVHVADPKAPSKIKKLASTLVYVPMNVLPVEKSKFIAGLGLSGDESPETKAGYVTTLGGMMSSTKTGKIKNISEDSPWIPGVKEIKYESGTKGAQDNQGSTIRVILVNDDGSTQTPIDVNSPGEAALRLWELKGYGEYKQSLGGQGGSSGGKFKVREFNP